MAKPERELLALTERDVYDMLPMRDCIRIMAEALAALAEGRAHLPLRSVMSIPDGRGVLAMMPGFMWGDGRSDAALGFKAVSVFPGNAERGVDTHQGTVALLDPDTGELRAVMDGGAITAIRTAAVSGVATDRLARKDAATAAILGAGVQARTHLEALAAVRQLQGVRVWSRRPERAREFVALQRSKYRFPVEAVPTAEAAVREADIVATVTASPEPVVSRSWVKPGVHINAVGSSTPAARELDTATVAAARVFVDSRESAMAEAGDLLIPIQEGAITADHIVAELGEVVAGKQPGRRSPEEITLFKSLGLAIEDVVAAGFVVRHAIQTRRGRSVAW